MIDQGYSGALYFASGAWSGGSIPNSTGVPLTNIGLRFPFKEFILSATIK